MKVFVTGGAGYIGSELVYRLSQLDEVKEIVIYDNLSRNNYNVFISHSRKMVQDKVKFVMGDLLDSRSLKKAMKGADVVYHLAAKVSTPHDSSDSHSYEQTNHWGTAEVVYAAEEEASVKKFVFLSSTGVYGFSRKDELVNEDSRLNPRSFYAISKMRGEEHVQRLMNKKETVIFRCANVYGYSPGIRFESVINKFLFDSHFNGRISIHGSGKQKRPFISLRCVIDSLEMVITKNVKTGIYNLVHHNTSILDLVDIFKELYPGLEFIFINQHLALRDLTVDPNCKFDEYQNCENVILKEEIARAKEEFAF